MKTKLTPAKSKTFSQICKLPRDNIDLGKEFWMTIGEDHVCITKQKWYEEPTEQIKIPRKYFNQIIKWYITGSKTGEIAPVRRKKNV